VRRQGASQGNAFVAAFEPYSVAPQLAGIEVNGASAGAKGPLAVTVIHQDGSTDHLYSAMEAAAQSSNGVKVNARLAFARVKDGRIQRLSLIGGSEFEGFHLRVRPATAGWTGQIENVNPETNAITTSKRLPVDGSLNGQLINFSGPGYSRNTAYHIAKVTGQGSGSRIHLDAPVVLGIGRVASVPDEQTLLSSIPHEYTHPETGRGDTGFLRGKEIRSDRGAHTHLRLAKYGVPMALTVESTAGFKPGDLFYYDDLQAGDDFEIDSLVTLTPDGKGNYHASGNTKVKFEAVR
jgi:hypothetical protein